MTNTTTATGYAVQVTSQTKDSDYRRQFIVACIYDSRFVFTRVTNGGRGESNAWRSCDYADFITFHDNTENVIGSPIAVTLSDTDVTSLTTGDTPINVFQKLSKMYANRPEVITDTTLGDVVKAIDNIITTDSSLLAQYKNDLRSNRVAPTNMKTIRVPQVIAPVLSVSPLLQEVSYPEEVLRYVPSLSDPEIANYIERTIDGVKEFDIYTKHMQEKRNIVIEGHAGTGKTTSAKVFAGKMGLPFYSISMNVASEPADFIGGVEPTEEGLKFIYGQLALAFKFGGVVLLDELSFIKEGCSASLHNALDGLRQVTLRGNNNEVINGNPNLLLIGAYNAGYRGTRPLNEAFHDRFATKLVFEYDKKIERQLIPSKSLLDLADKMRADSVTGLYETPISLRLLKNFVWHAQSFNYDFAVSSFLNSFTDEERASVKLLMEAYSSNISSELNASVNTPAVDTGDDN